MDGITISCSQCDAARIADDLDRAEAKARPAGQVAAQVVELGADEAGAKLADLLGLTVMGMTVKSAVTTGQGARASAQLELSNGEWLEFESLREMAHLTVLRAELAACAGVVPKITAADALQAVALLRQVARRQQTVSDDDLALDWGQSYLQAAQTRPVDMSDQADRWEAFSDLRSLDNAREEAGAAMTMVLVDSAGVRFVRSGHMYGFVRGREPGLSEGKIAQRLLRVGWTKPNASGRVKATQPGFGGTLNWSFFLVPADWPGNEVTAGTGLLRAREEATASCVEVVTGRYLVTSDEASA
ncbi:MAG: hypothetical protein WKF94_03685 [Solirubrobacteraceae bacterium]